MATTTRKSNLKNTKPVIHRILDMGLEHLPQPELKILRGLAEDGYSTPPCVRLMDSDGGDILLYVFDLNDSSLVEDTRGFDLVVTLELLRYAEKHRCNYLRLRWSGPVYGDLRTYTDMD